MLYPRVFAVSSLALMAASTAAMAETAATAQAHIQTGRLVHPIVAAPATGLTDRDGSSADVRSDQAELLPADGVSVSAALKAEILDRADRLRKRRRADSAADFKALKAFYAERDGAPLWVDDRGLTEHGYGALKVFETADDYGLDADDYRFDPEQIASLADTEAQAAIELEITKVALRYASHARGGRVDPSRLSYEIFVERPLKDPGVVLTELAQSSDRADYLVGLQPQHTQFNLLRKAYIAMRDRTGPVEIEAEPERDLSKLTKRERRRLKRQAKRKVKSRKQRLSQLRNNLEFWRWLPEDMGNTHIVANIPEYKVRIVRDGVVSFEERVIVGKIKTQTPLFSDQMEHLIFRPFWNLPNSLKVKKLLPGLLRGGNPVSSLGLRIKSGSRELNPRSINWRRNDIRKYHVYQPPGPGNALGNVKFMFPNKHAIYMHDTPSKNLFGTRQRSHSAGCVRVRNPDAFARALLSIANGWDERRTDARFRSGPDNDRVNFDTAIPVHLVYMTAWVDEETGKLQYFKDIYKHDRHMKFALAGQYNKIVRLKRSVEADVQRITARANGGRDGESRRRQRSSGSGFVSWWGGGNSGGSSSSSTGSSSVSVGNRKSWVQNVFGGDS